MGFGVTVVLVFALDVCFVGFGTLLIDTTVVIVALTTYNSSSPIGPSGGRNKGRSARAIRKSIRKA